MTGGDLVVESPDGTRLATARVGSGTPLVPVHGAVLARDAWQFVAPRLAERHTVWSYDRRGHGRSDAAPDMSLDRDVDDLVAVVAAAGPDVHLVGHSFGALVCLEAAARLPGLRSVVMYEPTLHFDRCDGAMRRCLELSGRDDPEGFLEVFMTDIAGVSAAELSMMRSIPEGWAQLVDGARRYHQHGDAFARAVEALLARRWAPGDYRSVAAPALLVMGTLTQAPLLASAEDVRAAVAHAEVATLDGQRHMAIAFDPARLADTVLAFTVAQDRGQGGSPASSSDRQPEERRTGHTYGSSGSSSPNWSP
jgi:pimeloyl-ACP methyl ester carboxylesterase